jgi:hypothetical protein
MIRIKQALKLEKQPKKDIQKFTVRISKAFRDLGRKWVDTYCGLPAVAPLQETKTFCFLEGNSSKSERSTSGFCVFFEFWVCHLVCVASNKDYN